MCGCLLCAHPTPCKVDPARNSGMGPDWESTSEPFGSQADAQSIEPHQPGNIPYFKENSLGQIPISHHILAKLGLFQSIKKFEDI